MSITTCDRCNCYVDTDLHEMFADGEQHVCEFCDAELTSDEEPMSGQG